MAKSVHQKLVEDYHREVGHHHNMHVFHRDWHTQWPDPVRPVDQQDPTWGTNIPFGEAFLQMHHEMVKSPPQAPRIYMQHESIAVWYLTKSKPMPAEWNPLSPIPADLLYEPDLGAYPAEIADPIRDYAVRNGTTPELFLTRKTNNPKYTFPRFFTVQGVGPGEPGERTTGARKLQDFANANQLGCCLVEHHNRWHERIGGAMNSFWTAIADPIFYFGVHWWVDKVFDDFKRVKGAPGLLGGGQGVMADDKVRVMPPREFTAAERDEAVAANQLSAKLREL